MSSGNARKPAADSTPRLAAWERIPPGSAFAFKATLARARTLANLGRFAAAEELFTSLPRPPGPDGSLVRQGLELILRIEGRNREVLPLIVETWEGAADPASVLRRVYLLDNSAFPIDYVRTTLDSGAPDDDRVWLGKANLAIWSGQFDEAAHWLELCTQKRPDDPAVWRARLELAIAALDLEGFERAAGHLPALDFTEVRLLRLRAWLAARLGDDRCEYDALLALVEQDPGNIGAWDRLSELAVRAGRIRGGRYLSPAEGRPELRPPAVQEAHRTRAIAPPTRRSWNDWQAVWDAAWKLGDGRSSARERAPAEPSRH